MKKRNAIVSGVVLAVIISVVGYSFLNPAEVEAIKIEKSDYTDTFEQDGTVVVSEEALINTTVSGKVQAIKVKEGDIVKAGDVLFTLEDTTLKYELSTLQGQKVSLTGRKTAEGEKTNPYEIEAQKDAVELAQTALDEANKNLDKNKSLYQEGIISQNDFEEYQKAMKDAQKNLEIQRATLNALKATNQLTQGSKVEYQGQEQQLDAQIDLLKYQIEQCVVKTPIDGVVSEFYIKKGDMVTPTSNAAKIFAPGKYSIEAYVLSEEAVELGENDDVQLTRKRKGKDDVFSGTIETIAPTAVERVSALGLIEQRVKVTIGFKGQENLKIRPGDEVRAKFQAYAQKNCYVLPKESIFKVPEGEAVWVVRDGKTALSLVEKTYETGRKTVIGNGLKEGDFVLFPLKDQKVAAGMKVKVKKIQ